MRRVLTLKMRNSETLISECSSDARVRFLPVNFPITLVYWKTCYQISRGQTRKIPNVEQALSFKMLPLPEFSKYIIGLKSLRSFGLTYCWFIHFGKHFFKIQQLNNLNLIKVIFQKKNILGRRTWSIKREHFRSVSLTRRYKRHRSPNKWKFP